VLLRKERFKGRASRRNAEGERAHEEVRRADPDKGDDGELVEELDLVTKDWDDLDELRSLVEYAVEVLRQHPDFVADCSQDTLKWHQISIGGSGWDT
jgi:hypothetical protein